MPSPLDTPNYWRRTGDNMDEKIGILTPTQRKNLQQSVAKCASCGDKLQYLRALGMPNEELEARRDHTANVSQAALDIDAEIKAKR